MFDNTLPSAYLYIREIELRPENENLPLYIFSQEATMNWFVDNWYVLVLGMAIGYAAGALVDLLAAF